MMITVAVLTYRRPEVLAESLPAIVEQVRDVADWSRGQHRAALLIVDNDPVGSARNAVASIDGADVRYVIERAAGVSAARNRAMDEAIDSGLLAFIDDDERPHPQWLQQLVATHARTSPAAVAGRVVAEFDGPLDPWISAGKFFVRRSLPTGSEVSAAGAGNLMLDLRVIRTIGLRFADSLGLSGGEDTLFTRTLTDAGYRMVWCNEAVITDRVPTSRMSRHWVLQRAWSHGNSAGLVDVILAGGSGTVVRSRVLGRGLLRVGGGASRFVLGWITRSNVHQARGLRAVWRGSGMMAAGIGLVFQEYARDPTTGSTARRLRRFAHAEPKRPSAIMIPDAEPSPRKLTVLLSFPATPPKGNPYRVLLERSLTGSPGLQVINFDWQTALFSRYDVFHMHWPEILVSGSTPTKRLTKQVLFATLLLKLLVTPTAIVRTVHNVDLPKEISRREILLLKWADRQTALRIRINTSTVVSTDQLIETIPHGHYKEWFAVYPRADMVHGRLLFFGLIRRYKGVDHLITAFRQISDGANLSLVALGQASTRGLADSLHALASDDPRIRLSLEFVEDAELVRAITEAELVVLPYREMHNSASVLTALSLDRPVLVPNNEVNSRLAEEVGHGWVFTYMGRLSGNDITAALATLRADVNRWPPNLDARNWDRAGSDHVVAYRRAASGATRHGKR